MLLATSSDEKVVETSKFVITMFTIRNPPFFDVIIRQACFSKQEYKDEIVVVEGKILLDVSKNMWMSQAKQVHVQCNKIVL